MKYSYNGIVLPALPEGDKEKYPYCCFIKRVENSKAVGYTLFASANKVKKGKGKDLEGPYAQYFIYYDDTEWTFEAYDNADNVAAFVIGQVLWSNYDIVNTDDGTIYLAASTPVPVTDHNALTIGWIVGQRLAAARIYNKPISVNIINLAATYSPYTANMELGELGSLGGNPLQIGHSGQAITYHNGHLTVEDQQ